nr:MAG TPA: hypothetical protein [Caudoviricetes sp.]
MSGDDPVGQLLRTVMLYTRAGFPRMTRYRSIPSL